MINKFCKMKKLILRLFGRKIQLKSLKNLKVKYAIFCLFILQIMEFCSNVPKTNIEITGKVKNTVSGMIYIQKFYNKMFFTFDSCRLDSGKFLFSEKLQVPELYGLTIDTAIYPLFVFLNANDKISVEFDTANFDNSKISGSADNDLYRQYTQAKGEVKIDSFIKKNPKSIVSTYLLYREYSYRLTPEEIEYNISLLDTSFKNTQYVEVLNELVNILKRVIPGNKALDFSLPDTSGKERKLSEFFGKPLLLDFWASWCSPCRRENPNLVKAYEEFKDKGLMIFSVSLDKKKSNWIKGINDDHLTWVHVSDLKYWNSSAAKLYGVRAIPSNVLIDASGTIIARNLYGPELETKLAGMFEKTEAVRK